MTEHNTLEAYPVRTHDKIRYADTDRQGHVNNATFATFLETGRVEILVDDATSRSRALSAASVKRLEALG